MDRVQLFNTFVQALDLGSLSRAAKKLGISQPAVSQQVSVLEHALGKELLFRSSRGVSATQAGEAVYRHARRVLDQVRALESELSQLDEGLSGRLRVSAPVALGKLIVATVILDLQSRYPDLDISLHLSDQLVDLVKDDFDLAIRTGALGETSGVARKIGMVERVLVASPAYLKRHGRPEGPEDLVKLRMIQYREDCEKQGIALIRDGREVPAAIRSTFITDNPDVVSNAIERGIGFASPPRFLVSEQLKSGKFVEVLPGWRVPDKALYLVYPSRATLSRRAECFIDALLAHFAAAEGFSLVSNRRSDAA